MAPIKAIADETRLRLLLVLAEVELNVNELTKLFDMGQSRISRHLRILSDAGLVSSRRQGQWSFYRRNGSDGRVVAMTDGVMAIIGNWTEPQMDLVRAREIVRSRSQTSDMFFSDMAAKKWAKLKEELTGPVDLDAQILEWLEERGTVADIGCGTGDLLLQLQKVCRHAIGVDHVPAMLGELKRRLTEPGTVDVRIGDVYHLPLRDGEADALVLNMVLHHLAQPDRVFSELKRVTRPDGQLLLVELDVHTQADVARRYGDVWMGFSGSDLENWLLEGGWSIVRKQGVGIGLGLRAHIISAKNTKKYEESK